MLQSEIDELLLSSLRNSRHRIFFQHHYLISQYKRDSAIKYLTTFELQNCIAVFVYGRKNNHNMGAALHVGINQSREQIFKAIEVISQHFTSVSTVTLVGGDFGITPPPFRSNVVANAINHAVSYYLRPAKITHDSYNKVGNLACCCYSLFAPFASTYTAALDLSSGKVLVSPANEVDALIRQRNAAAIQNHDELLNRQKQQYNIHNLYPFEFILLPETTEIDLQKKPSGLKMRKN